MRNTNELIQLDERDRDWKILRSILKFVRVHVNITVRRSPSNMNQDQKPARPIKDIVPRAGHYEFVVGQDMWTVRVRILYLRLWDIYSSWLDALMSELWAGVG